jgi:type VI secretion system VasD/TssJ family lipoprotein
MRNHTIWQRHYCLRILSGLLIVRILAACSSTPTELTISPEEWVYEDRAITITVKAPSDLNSVSGRPHSLAIGVFQLSDPNTFSGLSVTRDGAVELLQKGRIDETVANFTIINIRPGERRIVHLNRAQSAQYVGIIAGYFELNPKNDVKLFPIPLKAQKRGLVEAGLVAVSLMADEAKAKPDKLLVYMELGRSSSKQIVSYRAGDKVAGKADTSTESLEWMNRVNDAEQYRE